MTIFKLNAGGTPEVKEIENELSALQREVRGFIETVNLFADVTAIVNEEGLLIGLPVNRAIPGLVGPVLFVGTDGDEFCSLTEEQLEKLTCLFGTPKGHDPKPVE